MANIFYIFLPLPPTLTMPLQMLHWLAEVELGCRKTTTLRNKTGEKSPIVRTKKAPILRSGRQLGRTIGLEPTTTGTTNRGSTN